MNRSLFGKLIGAHLVLILVVFVTVGVASAYLLEHYFHAAKERELVANGTKLAHRLESHFALPGDSEALASLLHTFQDFTGTEVWVTDQTGLILMTSPANQRWEGERLADEEFYDLMSGHAVSRRGTSERFQRPMLSVAIPVMRNEVTMGAVFLHAPLIGVNTTIAGVSRLLLYSGLIAMVLATLFSYVSARRIAAPLTRMNRAVREMARGNFRDRVEVRSEDEVGRLGQAFNTLAGELDTTIRQLSQEKRKTEAVVRSMSDGVLFVDERGKVGMTNAAVAPFLVGGRDAVLGKPVTEALHLQEVVELFQEVLVTKPAAEKEVSLGDRTFTVKVASVAGDEGRNWGAVGLFHDTSQQSRLERMRRTFVANISHELRTPLTSIRGFLEAVVDGVARNRQEADEYLRIAIEETDRLHRLAHTLLDLSSIESGRVSMYPEQVPVHHVVQASVDKMLRQAVEKDVEIGVHLAEDLPLVRVDSDKIEQVILNLLDNGVRHTPPGGRVEISATHEASHVRVEVKDTGTGIPREEQPYVWERFYKVDKARRRSSGSGLGLVIVKELVEAHGGEVGLTSVPGQGTVFCFTIPTAEYAPMQADTVTTAT